MTTTFSREYLEAALEKAKELLPDWAWRQIHAAAVPIAGGRARHRPSDEPAALEKLAVADMRPSTLRAVDDQELLQAHHRQHQLYGWATRHGRADEPYVNAHVFVEAEMRRRGMHVDPDDELTAAAEQLTKALPDIPGLMGLPEEIVVVPGFVSLVGSAVQKGREAQDLDVLVRAPWVHRDDEDMPYMLLQAQSVTLPLRKVLDPGKRGRLHWVPSPQGPHADAIDLYDLVLRRRPTFEKRVVKADQPREAPAMTNWRRWLEHAPDGRWVDLGPGEAGPPDGFIGLGRPDVDLDQPWPLPDESVAVLRANHVLEHLTNPAHAMAEAWRVLMPGGIFIATVPAAGSRGDGAHPEHKSHWSADTFRFYADPQLLATIDQRPPQPFELLHLDEDDRGDGRVYVHAVLRKPDRVEKRALAPIARFTPPKPAMKLRAQTEAFRPEEIWDWVKRHADAGVVAEPKYNGFRAVLQKRGERVSLVFEDSQQERYDKLVRADAALEKLRDLPDCILDCDVGVIEGGRRRPRPRLMTLTADRPELPSGTHVAITAFDVLYWDGESVNERPFRDRRALLERIAPQLRRVGIQIPPEVRIETLEGLRRVWRSPRFGRADRSEGLVLKALDWVYEPGSATDGMAKVQHSLEIKALVLETKRTAHGRYNFRGGILPGAMRGYLDNVVEFRGKEYVDLGFSFNGEFAMEPGDIGTFQVEEITWDQPDRRLNWLGAKPIDRDNERTEPYSAAQVIDLARRALVLQDVPAPTATRARIAKAQLEDDDDRGTRADAARQNWEQHWHEAMPTSGKALPFILHAHWRGLTEDEAARSMDELLETRNSLHFDLRLATDRFDGWWGISLFAGTTAQNRKMLRVFRMMRDPEEKLESAPKLFGPKQWLSVGLKEPLVVEPGGVGSTSRAWSKFFAIDHGTWRLGFARQHGIEIWLDGQRLKGRFLWQYAPVEAGRRTWLLTRPRDQRPYAQTHDLEDVIAELRQKRQRYLFWPKDPHDLSKGMRQIDVVQKAQWTLTAEAWVDKADPEKRLVYGVVLVPDLVDVQGDVLTAEAIEQAAHRFLVESRRIGVQHQYTANAQVVESYIAPQDLELGGRTVPKGSWVLVTKVLDDALWERIKNGELTGYSIGGVGVRQRMEVAM